MKEREREREEQSGCILRPMTAKKKPGLFQSTVKTRPPDDDDVLLANNGA